MRLLPGGCMRTQHARSPSLRRTAVLSVLIAGGYGCDSMLVGMVTTPPVNASQPPNDLNGFALYAANCQTCHNVIERSAKRGRTVVQIRNALATIPQMSAIRLNDEELRAIEYVLNGGTYSNMNNGSAP